MWNSYIWPMCMTVSGATVLVEREPGNEGVFYISPNLQEWSLNIRLFNIISRTLIGGESYPSADIQSVYSTAPVNWGEERGRWERREETGRQERRGESGRRVRRGERGRQERRGEAGRQKRWGEREKQERRVERGT